MDKKKNTMSFQFNSNDRKHDNDRKRDVDQKKKVVDIDDNKQISYQPDKEVNVRSKQEKYESDAYMSDNDEQRNNIYAFHRDEYQEPIHQLNESNYADDAHYKDQSYKDQGYKNQSYKDQSYKEQSYKEQSYSYNRNWGDDSGTDSQLESSYFSDNHRIPLSRYNHRKKRIRKSSASSGTTYNQINNSIWASVRNSSKIVVTAGSAILIGILLGLIVLSIFSNLEENERTGTNQGEQALPNHTSMPGQDENTSGEEANEGEGLILDPSGNPPAGEAAGETLLPPRLYFVVQAGVFSEESAAQEVVSSMQSAGRAGIYLENETPYRTYIGMTGNRDDAQRLSSYFEQQDIEFFVRQHETPAFISLHPAAEQVETEALKSFLDRGDQLLEKVNQAASQGVADEEYQLSSDEWSAIQEAHRLFLEESHDLSPNWKEGEEWIGEMVLQLTEAVNTLETFRTQQHTSFLWKVQQHSLQYLKQYEEWLRQAS